MARTRFDICLDEVLRHEGGYADHPSDPGGATNLGITRQTLADWRQVSPWWALDKAEVRGLKRDEAALIYRANYWDRSGAGNLPPGSTWRCSTLPSIPGRTGLFGRCRPNWPWPPTAGSDR